MTIFDIILVVATFVVLGVAVIILGYRSRWWQFLFALCAFVAYLVICMLLPTALDASMSNAATIASTSENSKIVPVYVIILGYSIMLLVVTMVCGSIFGPTKPGNSGRVGLIIIAFIVVVIAIMPAVYAYYRVFLVASAIGTLGILIGSSLGALWSMVSSRSNIKDRKYGSQTFSHILYYLSLAALITTAANCNSIDDIFGLLTTSVLASATATVGILVESRSWTLA